MLLYSKQIIRLKRYNEPAIFLGYDKTNSKRIWAICLDNNGEPELDWFSESDVDYYHTKALTSIPTPGNTQIIYGKFKTNSCIPLLQENPSKEEIATLGEYVKMLYDKYVPKEETKETTTT